MATEPPGAALRASLSGSFAGRLVLPEDSGYDEARRVWNGTVDRQPAAIAYCTSTSDVSAAVRAARQTGLPLSVRGGGHQVAGLSLSEGGLVIDLSELNTVTLNADHTVARAGGGCLLRHVDTATSEFGRIVPAGVVSHTGLGGLALGGGVGWTFRNFGLTCDNIVGAEVVTADGSVHHASEDDDAELLWALRGGGGNFGVVTAFDLATHPLVDVLFGQAVYPIEDAPQAIAHYVATMAKAPDALTAICITCGAPPLPGVPPELIGRPAVMINAAWSGDPQEGVAPLRELIHTEKAAGADIIPMRYPEMQTMQDHLHPHGRFNYNKSRYLDRVDDSAIKALLEAGRALPGRHCQVEVLRLGGAAARVAPEATAFAHRDAGYILNVVAAWTDQADADRTIQWARDTYSSLDSVGSQAGYINFLELEPDRVLSVYPPATYERLRKIKRRLDPDNVFHGNVPIEPAP